MLCLRQSIMQPLTGRIIFNEPLTEYSLSSIDCRGWGGGFMRRGPLEVTGWSSVGVEDSIGVWRALAPIGVVVDGCMHAT